jgi:hypothetical protein
MPASIIEIDQIFKIIFIHSSVIYLHNIIFKAHAHSIKIKNLDNKIKMRKSFYFHTNFKILFKTQNKNLKYNLATQAVFGIYPTNLWTSTNR